jgi:hypothetical protein
MAKDDPDIVRLAGRHVFELFRNANTDSPLIYHGLKRSRELVDACREIAKGSKLNGADAEVLLLSAWFHDAGSAAGNGGREKSIEIARAFLAHHEQPKSLADAVAACLEVVDDGDTHDGLADEVLHDALLAPLASKNYVAEAELLRLEEEGRTGKRYSDVEWTQSRIDYLHKHTYRTRWAQLEYNGPRAKNLVRLHKLLRRQMEEAAEHQADDAKVANTLGRVAGKIFGDLTSNQFKLLSIADRRTSTMIHVNAIMISLVVGLVLRKIDEYRHLLVPTVALLCVNLAVVILSILSLRAGRWAVGRFLREETPAYDANLLVVSNEDTVRLPDYVAGMNELLADPPGLQKAMIEYLYFLRKQLIRRRQALQLTYDIFIYGLAISLVFFAVAIVRR